MVGGANALYAVGQGALGFSPFAIDSITGDESLPRAYAVLQQLSPLLGKVSKGQISLVLFSRQVKRKQRSSSVVTNWKSITRIAGASRPLPRQTPFPPRPLSSTPVPMNSSLPDRE